MNRSVIVYSIVLDVDKSEKVEIFVRYKKQRQEKRKCERIKNKLKISTLFRYYKSIKIS